MIAVKPLLSALEIVEWWPQLEPAFNRTLEYSAGDDDLENVLQKLITGQMIVWLALVDGEYMGSLTTRAVHTRHKGETVRALIFDHVFQNTLKHGALYEVMAEPIKEYARRSGCKLIKTFTTRKIERRMKQIGMEPTYTEYQMVL